MKIAITGASGFLGQELVKNLSDVADILVVGRDLTVLKKIYPHKKSVTYSNLEVDLKGYDIVIHCAAVNNNLNCSKDEFFDGNVNLTKKVAEESFRAGVQHFIFISSSHALLGEISYYALSKIEAQKKLQLIYGLKLTTIYLPMVYGEKWSGKLSILSHLPRSIAFRLFKPIASLKATASTKKVADWIKTFGGKDNAPAEVIISEDQNKNIYYFGLKKVIDLSFAFFVIIFLWWLLLIIWLVIKMQSSGPGIFRQERIGKNGKPFICYKFRTMRIGTKEAGTHEISQSAITPIGSFLRRTKLDELPQVWNILRNEISLVGPRPCLPIQTELIAERMQRGVYDVKPGITGLAQINGIDMSDPGKLAVWDSRYCALRSTFLDLNIAIATAIGKGRGDKTSL